MKSFYLGKVFLFEIIQSKNQNVEHLDDYIKEEIENLYDIEKSEIYLPFAAQKLLSENVINIDVVDSDSKWFGITYREDKDNSVKKLASYTRDGIYPSPLWS